MIETAEIIWVGGITGLSLVLYVQHRALRRQFLKARDAKVYWQHRAQCQIEAASRRGRYARSCQMSQTRAKVLTKALQINEELGR